MDATLGLGDEATSFSKGTANGGIVEKIKVSKSDLGSSNTYYFQAVAIDPDDGSAETSQVITLHIEL